jgi:hypothetical protein
LALASDGVPFSVAKFVHGMYNTRRLLEVGCKNVQQFIHFYKRLANKPFSTFVCFLQSLSRRIDALHLELLGQSSSPFDDVAQTTIGGEGGGGLETKEWEEMLAADASSSSPAALSIAEKEEKESGGGQSQ